MATTRTASRIQYHQQLAVTSKLYAEEHSLAKYGLTHSAFHHAVSGDEEYACPKIDRIYRLSFHLFESGTISQ